MTGKTPFGTVIKYRCGEGRKLMSGIDEKSGAPVLYDEYFTFCQWNQTYAKDPKSVSRTTNLFYQLNQSIKKYLFCGNICYI